MAVLGLTAWLLIVTQANVHSTGVDNNDPPVVTVNWGGDPSCQGKARVEELVGQLLGRRSGANSGVKANIEVSAPSPMWKLVAEITSGDVSGERVFEATSCEALIEAVSLSIALVVDPESVFMPGDDADPVPSPATLELPAAVEGAVPEISFDEPGEDVAAQDAERTKKPLARIEPKKEAIVENPVDRPEIDRSEPAGAKGGGTGEEVAAAQGKSDGAPIGVGLNMGLGLGLGVLPGAAGTVSLAAHLRGRGYWLGLLGTAWLLKTIKSARSADVSGEFGAVVSALQACGVPSRKNFEFPLCVSIGLNTVFGRAIGAVEGAPARATYVALGGGPGIRWSRSGPVAFLFQIDGNVPMRRPQFETVPSGLLYRVPAIGVRFMLGIELRPGTKR